MIRIKTAAVLFALLSVGCTMHEQPLVVDPAFQRIVGSAEYADPGLNLARDVFVYEQGLEIPPFRFELIPAAASIPSMPDDVGGLSIEKGDEPAVLTLPCEVAAAEYNRISIRMRASGGTKCSVKWASDFEPSADRNPGISFPILADGEFHPYSFPLDYVMAETWAGTIGCIYIEPTDEPADVFIEEIFLEYVPPEIPLQVTIEQQTYPAFQGDFAWEVDIPLDATLDVSMGMLARGWYPCNSDGVTFTIRIQTHQGTDTLAEFGLDPVSDEDHRVWQDLSLPLEEYGGKRAALLFSLDHNGSRAGDYAYWGNPTIRRRGKQDGGTPIILVSCDTMRADHLACYGYGRKTSPTIDKLAEESVVFERAITQDVWTLTAHMTMLTGLYPKTHRLARDTILPASMKTIAEVLSERGYRSGGFTGHGWWLLPWRGYSRGFEVYNTPLNFRGIEETRRLVDKWLRKLDTDQFFLFFHNYDIHLKPEEAPYTRPYDPGDDGPRVFSGELEPPEMLREDESGESTYSAYWQLAITGRLVMTDTEREFMAACYDDCIHYVDRQLSLFFDTLKLMGLYDKALIIVTADHGEELSEHRRSQHLQAYHECTHVPLIVKFPHGRHGGKRVADLVQLTDLYQTVLDEAGVESIPANEGCNLAHVAAGTAAAPEEAFAERRTMQSVYKGDWKLLRKNAPESYELYNLADDPGEQVNLYADSLPVLPELRRILEEFYPVQQEGWHVLIQNDSSLWNGQLELVTDDQFAFSHAMQLDQGDRAESIVTDRLLMYRLDLFPHRYGEHIVFDTRNSCAVVHLQITSDEPFQTVNSAGEFEDVTELSIQLDPANPRFAGTQKGIDDPRTSIPRLFIWHAQDSDQTPKKELSEEGQRALKALGYL